MNRKDATTRIPRGLSSNSNGRPHAAPKAPPKADSGLPLSYSVNDLLAEVKKMTNASRGDIMSHIYSIVHPLGIKVAFELTNGPQRDAQHEDSFAFLDAPEVKLGRIILSPMKNKANMRYKIVNECNGLVIDSATWEPLVRPTEAFNSHANRAQVAQSIENYDIYPMFDGTFINLYHYDGAWRMSSTNGFDIGHYTWMGPLTYQEALDNILAKYPNFSYDNLNKAYCYGLVFKFYDFHPFMGDEQGAYLIKVCDPITNTIISKDEIGALQVGIPYVIPINEMLAQGSTQGLYDRIQSLASNSIKLYTERRDNGPPPVIYGFVLRAKQDAPNVEYFNSNVSIESTLFKAIRRFIYGVKDIKAPTLDHINRLEYLALRAYLNTPCRLEFITLFQQYHEKFTNYGLIINKVVDRLSKNLRTKRPKDEPQRGGQFTPIIDQLVKYFTPIIAAQRLNSYDRNNKSTIENIIVDPKYITEYYKALYD